jgi:hypothetical protein
MSGLVTGIPAICALTACNQSVPTSFLHFNCMIERSLLVTNFISHAFISYNIVLYTFSTGEEYGCL